MSSGLTFHQTLIELLAREQDPALSDVMLGNISLSNDLFEGLGRPLKIRRGSLGIHPLIGTYLLELSLCEPDSRPSLQASVLRPEHCSLNTFKDAFSLS